MADQVAAAETATSSSPPTLRDVLTPLETVPESDRKFGCRMLLQCRDLLEACQSMLRNRKSVKDETLADQNKCVALSAESALTAFL